jgi:hypothetical protein
MHVVIAVLTIIASLKWGNWKSWREYQGSMFFICVGGLLYEYIVKENTLWKFQPDFLYGQEMTVIVYALITMPISILIFLSHFPKKWFQKIIYIFLWSGIYIFVEWILFVFKRISYQNGWKFGYSFLFDIVMFSVIALHQSKPLFAYILSIFITIFLINYFHVPFTFVK